MKEIIWNEKAKKFIRDLDTDTKREIGTLLMILQAGETLGGPQSKPMKVIHKNAFELRIKDRKGNYRVIYVLATKDAIIIPHAFNKKTQKIAKKEITVAQSRLKEILDEIK